MNRLTIVCLVLLSSLSSSALAEDPKPADAARADIKSMFGFVPDFLQKMPDSALPGAWEEMKTLQMNPKTALAPKTKELIGLAVASQIPCKYCIYAHTEFSKLNGATDTERGEAVVLSALTRHWSTVLHGEQTDIVKFKQEIAGMLAYARSMMAGKTPMPAPVNVVDAASAMQDIQNQWGAVPDFIKGFPAVALSGAWKEERDVEMSDKTAISGKDKSLIGLAVAAQVPCRFCVAADTEFAKMMGASEAEISEAIAMAALTRHWSTYLNGMQIDEKGFMKDVDRLVKGAKKMMTDEAKKASAQKETPKGEMQVAQVMPTAH